MYTIQGNLTCSSRNCSHILMIGGSEKLPFNVVISVTTFEFDNRTLSGSLNNFATVS